MVDDLFEEAGEGGFVFDAELALDSPDAGDEVLGLGYAPNLRVDLRFFEIMGVDELLPGRRVLVTGRRVGLLLEAT